MNSYTTLAIQLLFLVTIQKHWKKKASVDKECLVLLLIAVINTISKKQHGRKGSVSSYSLWSITEAKAGTEVGT